MQMNEDFKSNSILSISTILCIILGLTPAAFGVILSPATFDEYAGLPWSTASGISSSIAETVQVAVTADQTGNSGSGSGYAMTDSLLQPVVTETALNLSGGPNGSGVGGTTYTAISYQFAVVPLEAGLPITVPLIFSTTGHVLVDTSLTNPNEIGSTYARINSPGGNFSAQNYDAYGAYEGYFSFDQTVTVNVAVNTAKTILLWTNSHGQGGGESFFYNSQTYVDLDMMIDPAFEYRDQFALVYSQAIVTEPADISRDGIVSWIDFSMLAEEWLLIGEGLVADIDVPGGDGIVDVEDLAVIIGKWLNTEPWYQQP